MLLPRQPRLTVTGNKKVDDALKVFWEEIARTVDGQLNLGGLVYSTPFGRQNIDGNWIAMITPAGADTDFTLTHNLGRIPTGFLVADQDKGAVTYRGSVPWTETEITLKTNMSTVSIVVFIF